MLYLNHNLHSCIDVAFKNYKNIETPPERLRKTNLKKYLLQSAFQLNFIKKLRNLYKLLKLIIEMY